MSEPRRSPRFQTTVRYPVELCPSADDDDDSLHSGGSLSGVSDSTYANEEESLSSDEEEGKDGSEQPSVVNVARSGNARASTKVSATWDRPTNECPCCDTFNPFELSGPYGTGKTVYAGYTCICRCRSSWIVEKGHYQYNWSHTPHPVFVVGHHPQNAKEYSNVSPSQLWHPVFGPAVRRFDRLSDKKPFGG